MRTNAFHAFALAGLLAACGSDSESAEAPAEAPTPPPVPTAEPTPAPPADAYPNEACMQGVLVAYDGATPPTQGVTRTKEEAAARAQELRERVAGGEDIAAVARAEGDGTRAARGGQLGTYARDAWPDLYGPLKDAAFGLQVGALSDVVEAPFGYVFFQRCPVEKVHTRHILVRYQGAHNAGADVTRSKDEARALAQRLRGEAAAPGADFAALAREHSEDGSAAQGGDIGEIGRGLLEPEYEAAAFALAPGQTAEVVETRVGFHVIQRVPD